MSDIDNIVYHACPLLTHPLKYPSASYSIYPVLYMPRTRQKSFQDDLLHLLRTGRGLGDCDSVGRGVVFVLVLGGAFGILDVSILCIEFRL